MMFKMNKVLEKRISRLEKFISRKNESVTEYSDLVYDTVDATVDATNASLQRMFDTLLDAYNKGQDMRYAANALRFNKESVPKYWQDRFDYLADKFMK